MSIDVNDPTNPFAAGMTNTYGHPLSRGMSMKSTGCVRFQISLPDPLETGCAISAHPSSCIHSLMGFTFYLTFALLSCYTLFVQMKNQIRRFSVLRGFMSSLVILLKQQGSLFAER
jgi:hypothetical protein